MSILTGLMLTGFADTLVEAEELYRFTDEAGTIHFVDDYGKVPRRFRRQTGVTRAPYSTAARQSTTRVTITNRQVLVPVTVESAGRRRDLIFLLDTGASQSGIVEATAAALGLAENESDALEWQVAGGGIINGRCVRITALTVGPHHRRDVEIGIIPHHGSHPGYDGFLGMDVLGSLDYRLDVPMSVIHWNN